MPFAPSSDDTIILNEAGEFSPTFVRRGVSTRKKQRTSIEIISAPILFDLDDMVLGAKPAEAVRDELSKDTKAIGDFVSPATQARRALAAANPGAKWVQKRYAGGRTGFKAPNQTQRWGNDSGRLADGWFVRENKTDQSWTVNAPANRLDPTTFGAGFEKFIAGLRERMPILNDARELLNRDKFNAAVSSAVGDVISVGEMKGDAASVMKLKQLAAAKRAAVRALLAAGRAVLGG